MIKNKRKHYDLFDVPLTQIPGGHIPVLLIDGNISIFALFYARELQRIGYAYRTIEKKLSSVGRLWDYYLSTPKHMHGNNFLTNFCEARINGTIHFDKSDYTGLRWTPPKYETAIRDFINVSEFIEFSAEHFDAVSLNPKERAYQGSLEYARKHEIKKKYSLLYHAIQNENYVEVRKHKRIDRYGKSNKATRYKFFPPHKIADLLNEMTTTRDKLIIILLAFGGIRISELLHIYITDISIDKDGTAKVALYNPVEGEYKWIGIDDKKNKGTRRQYLSNMHGTLPRNLLSVNDGMHLGWKGMQEEDSKKHVSYVSWTVIEMGQAFYSLHQRYIKEKASLGGELPYYFVAMTGKNKGQPLRETSLTNHLKNKFKAIGLSATNENAHPHALRHYYGYFAANVLGLDSDILQSMMHHASRSSTEIYYQLTRSTVRTALEEGYKRIGAQTELLQCLH